jgi:hypothetical protein
MLAFGIPGPEQYTLTLLSWGSLGMFLHTVYDVYRQDSFQTLDSLDGTTVQFSGPVSDLLPLSLDNGILSHHSLVLLYV